MPGCFGALGSSLPPEPTLGPWHQSCERLRRCLSELVWVRCSLLGVKGTDAPSFPALGAKGSHQHPRAHLELSPPANSAQDGSLISGTGQAGDVPATFTLVPRAGGGWLPLPSPTEIAFALPLPSPPGQPHHGCLPATREPILGDVGCSFQHCSKPKGDGFSTHPPQTSAELAVLLEGKTHPSSHVACSNAAASR